MSSVNRWIIKDDSNGVDPTGMSNLMDSATMLRKCETHLGRGAQGAMACNLALALNPVAAQATVHTTNGSETAADTLTVAGVAITMEGSGATGNQANIAAGTAGTSVGGTSAATTTASANLTFAVNINGDGPQQIVVNDGGTHTGAAVAAAIQAAIRALTAINPLNAVAYSAATCSYGSTKYTVTSGVAGFGSSVVITGYQAATLKLGIQNGGTETAGTATTLDNIAAVINSASGSFAGICSAFVCGANMTLTAAIPGTIGNGLALSVSSTGTVMTISHAWGTLVAGTEGTSAVFGMGK